MSRPPGKKKACYEKRMVQRQKQYVMCMNNKIQQTCITNDKLLDPENWGNYPF